jgi:16S rRNA (guanine(966)-N(2))-methyltransferase RsmD
MRVIAGSARGRRLHSPAGSRVRPTADRVKEALFSALTSRFGSLEGLAVLDLFAGSGALGIEALSRGAARVFFIDSHRESSALTQRNLALTGLEYAATRLMMDAGTALERFAAEGTRFDIILVDPPYTDRKLAARVSGLLTGSHLTGSHGVIVFETDSAAELSLPESFQLYSRKVYGDTALSFFEPAEGFNDI